MSVKLVHRNTPPPETPPIKLFGCSSSLDWTVTASINAGLAALFIHFAVA
jgi:hypothetical protein